MSTLNVNVGVLGHVDSGKTSLSKALSSVASTAAFDKNPQSQERGITLDLGFSAFYTEAPEQIKPHYESVQFTLVDCPGHASLIRTIIGGAQIIDMMILVIDVTKGIQTQTSECIIIGEILAKKLLVVLNKIDLIPEKERAQKIDRTKKALVSKVFANTRFPNPMIIPVCALQDDSLKELIDAFKSNVEIPDNTEHNKLPFLFAVDHCFAIKGKGTVLTGTVLQGTVTLEQTVDIPSLNEQKKIKSIQMFKKPVKSASSGDRIGALVTQLEPSRFERGFIAEPNFVKTIDCLICSFEPIRYYKRAITTKSKLHITVGHSTVMGVLHFFKGNWPGTEFEYLDSVEEQKDVLVRIDLETSVACYPNAKLIASKLDTDIHANVCRLAFYGTVLEMCNKNTLALKVYKNKEKNAQVDRLVDEYNLIGKNLVKKDGTLNPYIGKKVIVFVDEKQVSNGTIVSSFGSSGKFKVRLEEPLATFDTKVLSLKLLYKVNSWDKTSAWVQ